jgi:hypothetical protein
VSAGFSALMLVGFVVPIALLSWLDGLGRGPR